MKTAVKYFAFCLTLCTLFSSFGCTSDLHDNIPEETTAPIHSESYTEATTTHPADTEAESEETTAPSPAVQADPISIAITLEPAQTDDVADDGVTVYFFRYQTIALTMQDHPQAAASISEQIRAVIETAKEKSESSRAWAKESYTPSSDWMAYYTDLTYYPGRMDDAVISLYATGQDFTGGSHPNYTMLSSSFYTQTGEELRILDILHSEDGLTALQALVLEQLSGESTRLQLNDDYEQVVSERFDPTNLLSANWYFSDAGLVYYFAPYEIAPYRSGVIEVELPYEMLRGVLLDTFLPNAPSEATPDIHGGLADDVAEEFDQIYTITLDEDGENVLLYGFDGVQQLQISLGYWGITDNQFYVTSVLFTGHAMTGKDCISIRTFIPDAIPNIRIIADDATLYLAQSGEDGSILLLEDGTF